MPDRTRSWLVLAGHLTFLGVYGCGCGPGCGTNGKSPTTVADTQPPEDPERPRLPMEATPPEGLSNAQIQHTELLRIRRNFGKEHFEIALDAWIAIDVPDKIHDARLWWARTDKGDERSPFGESTRGHFEIRTQELAPDRWDLELISDKKKFVFHVEIAEDGKPAAFADVMVGPMMVTHCRASVGILHARRLLGAPVGIRKLEVTCIDDQGTVHEGRVLDGDE
jgi:hypothetical protein